MVSDFSDFLGRIFICSQDFLINKSIKELFQVHGQCSIVDSKRIKNRERVIRGYVDKLSTYLDLLGNQELDRVSIGIRYHRKIFAESEDVDVLDYLEIFLKHGILPSLCFKEFWIPLFNYLTKNNMNYKIDSHFDYLVLSTDQGNKSGVLKIKDIEKLKSYLGGSSESTLELDGYWNPGSNVKTIYRRKIYDPVNNFVILYDKLEVTKEDKGKEFECTLEDDLKVRVELSGLCLENYDFKGQVGLLLNLSLRYGLRPNRLDNAIDDYGYSVDIEKMFDVASKGDYTRIKKPPKRHITCDFLLKDDGKKVPIKWVTDEYGSRQSNKFLRVYDTGYKHAFNAMRFEGEFKRSSAQILVLACIWLIGNQGNFENNELLGNTFKSKEYFREFVDKWYLGEEIPDDFFVLYKDLGVKTKLTSTSSINWAEVSHNLEWVVDVWDYMLDCFSPSDFTSLLSEISQLFQASTLGIVDFIDRSNMGANGNTKECERYEFWQDFLNIVSEPISIPSPPVIPNDIRKPLNWLVRQVSLTLAIFSEGINFNDFCTEFIGSLTDFDLEASTDKMRKARVYINWVKNNSDKVFNYINDIKGIGKKKVVSFS